MLSLLLVASATALLPAAAAEAAAGGLDPAFGVGGTTRTDFPAHGDDKIGDIAVQADGKIVAVGETTLSTNPQNVAFAIARYQPGGQIDSTFHSQQFGSQQGKVVLDFGPGIDRARAVAIQPDGKIVVVGEVYADHAGNGNFDFAVIRLNSDGSPDNTSFNGGFTLTQFGTADDVPADVALQPDGKIVVAGTSSGDFALARYDTHGTLDTTFDGDGKLTTAVADGPGNDTAHALALQPDGKIVVAGSAGSGPLPDPSADLAVVRYLPTGALDQSFDADGKVTTPVGSNADVANDIAIQPDGRIVVAGESNNGTNLDFALARYDTDGSLDTSFDSDGKVTTAVGTGGDSARALLLQPDGRIVVAGVSGEGSNDEFALARYRVGGRLDTSFGGDGKLTTPFGTGTDGASAVALQNGKIVAAGESSSATNGADFALARYFAVPPPTISSFDPASGPAGTEVTITGANFLAPVSVFFNGIPASAVSVVSVTQIKATAPAGAGCATGKISIMAAGGTTVSATDFAHVLPPANLDFCFDGEGKLRTPIDGTAGASDVVVQPDGKIVVAGRSAATSSGETDFALARYNADGSLDTSFGGDGKVTTELISLDDRDDAATALAVQPDGKIVAVGWTDRFVYDYDGGAVHRYFAVVRYNADGSLDTSFDGDGKMVGREEGAEAEAVVLQADGKIVVGGTWGYDLALARYRADGSLDTTFGAGGVATATVVGQVSHLSDIARQRDGKIVVGGWTFDNPGSEFALARFNSNGSLDTSFDGDGNVMTPMGGDASLDYAHGVAIQPDGRIVLAGGADIGTDRWFALARYNADGSLDPSFDGDGKLITSIGDSSADAEEIAVQPDGRIVVPGWAYNGTDKEFALARYNADGTLDTTFDGDGKLMTPMGDATDAAHAVALQADGRIVVAGTADNGGHDEFAVARYHGGPIVSFTPAAGVAGVTSVTLTSADLSGATSVRFNGKSAAFGVISPTQIQATVPAGATTGAISVTTPGGTVASFTPFRVTLSVTASTPPCGVAGTAVSVKGLGFRGVTGVTFNGSAASYTVKSGTSIAATVPVGATTGPVGVTTGAGTSMSAASFIVTTLAAPAISGFTPTSGPTRTAVTIRGSNLCGATGVSFNGKPAAFRVVTNGKIVATVPNGATSGNIEVTTPGGITTSAGDFTVTLSVTGFSPTSGPANTFVTIRGVGFTSDATVRFNGVAASSMTFYSPTKVIVAVPEAATTGRISVTTTAGTAHSAKVFTKT